MPVQPCVQAADGQLLYGEVSSDPLGNLATTLSSLYASHVAEKTDWGEAEEVVKQEFKADLSTVTAALKEMVSAVHDGLDLSPVPPAVNLAEAVRATQPKSKSKKAVIDADTVDQLQSEYRRPP